MANRLLDRQVRLLDYLTSGAAIFGDAGGAPRDPALRGIDPALLRLEARFSYHKRLDKIADVFPKTFARLADGRSAILRDFVEACPPDDIGRLANARQFYDFLVRRWQRQPPEPPYLRDVAACELACAMVGAGAQPEPEEHGGPPRRGIRRHPGIVLLRCAHDVRPIFEDDAELPVVERDTRLAVLAPIGGGASRVLELAPAVFDLLAVLDNWTDPAAVASAPQDLILNLSGHGLIEVAR